MKLVSNTQTETNYFAVEINHEYLKEGPLSKRPLDAATQYDYGDNDLNVTEELTSPF